MTYRVLQFQDVHLSDQPPRMRTSEYRSQILAKLEAAMSLAAEHHVNRVICCGDLYHRFQASHTSHATVQAVRKILNAPGIEVSLVVGNHDRARGGALEGQPLLSTLGDNVTLLEGPHPTEDIAGFGWTNELAGTEAEIEAHLATGVWNVERSLVFVHGPLVLEPFPFGPAPAGWITLEKVIPHLKLATLYLGHGHMHSGHDVLAIARPTMSKYNWLHVANPGALSRATIAEDDRNRVPQVALITLDDGRVEVEYLPLPYVPVEEAFLVDQKGRDDERGDNIQALAASLLEGVLHVVTADSLTEAIQSLPVPDGVRPQLFERAQVLAVEAIENATA